MVRLESGTEDAMFVFATSCSFFDALERFVGDLDCRWMGSAGNRNRDGNGNGNGVGTEWGEGEWEAAIVRLELR